MIKTLVKNRLLIYSLLRDLIQNEILKVTQKGRMDLIDLKFKREIQILSLKADPQKLMNIGTIRKKTVSTLCHLAAALRRKRH